MEHQFKTVKVELAVSAQHIYYAVVGSFEGGSNYWLKQADYSGPKTPDPARKLVWWGHEELYDDDFEMVVKFDDPDHDEGNEQGEARIAWEDMVKGLERMAQGSPQHFADLISDGNADATTYDVYMQYVVLGEVHYG